MDEANLPIGIFDSGIGGISVMKEIIHLMPEENYIYYGDSANAPYGTKSLTEVRHLSDCCAAFLLAHGAKAIVIACNTATSAAASMLRSMYPELPIVGIEPAVKPAVLWKEHDRVGVMATPMTLNQAKYKSLMHTYENRSKIYSIPCPGLMEFVERGELCGPALEQYLSDTLSPYLKQGLDAIVLGCTHYPFVEPAIRKVAGPDIQIFNGNGGTARELKRRLESSGLKSDATTRGSVMIYNSSPDKSLIRLCHRLLEA